LIALAGTGTPKVTAIVCVLLVVPPAETQNFVAVVDVVPRLNGHEVDVVALLGVDAVQPPGPQVAVGRAVTVKGLSVPADPDGAAAHAVRFQLLLVSPVTAKLSENVPTSSSPFSVTVTDSVVVVGATDTAARAAGAQTKARAQAASAPRRPIYGPVLIANVTLLV
jgi:hypothetical protein